MKEKNKKKDGFVLYASQYESIKDLTCEQKGTLLDAIFKHVLSIETPTIFDGEVRMAFMFIKNQIDRDSERYEDICARRREYGKRGGEANGSISKQKVANGSISKQMQASEADKDKDKDNDLQESKDSMSKDIIPPKPPKGSESQKEKPLWKESYEEWKRLFLEAKEELLNDLEFKEKQQHYYPNIDYVKTIEKNCDYWLREETWQEEKRKRVQTIHAKQRIKNNFDKNKVFFPFQRNAEEEQKKEQTIQERHTKFVEWLSKQVKEPEKAMSVFHVTLDNFIEMLKASGGDAGKLAETVKLLLKEKITVEEGLIGAFRKHKGNKK